MQSVLEEHSKLSSARLSARLVAFLIDTFGIYFGIVALSVLTQMLFPENIAKVIAWIFLSVYAIYFVFRDAMPNCGLGKWLLSIRTVTDKDGPVEQCSILQSFLRNTFTLIPPYIILEIWVLLLRKDKKRIGDFLASTRVVEIPPNMPHQVKR